MAAHVAASSGAAVGTSTQVSTLATPTLTAVPAGATVVIMVGALRYTAGDTVSITDNASGNTYTQVDPASGMTADWAGSTDYNAATFIGNNIQNGPTIFTVHYSHTGGTDFGIIVVDCFTGCLTSALGGHVLTAPAAQGSAGANVVATTAYSSTAGSVLWAAAFNINSNGATSAGTTLTWVGGVTITGNEGMTEYILSGPGGNNAATFGDVSSSDNKWLVGSIELKVLAGGTPDWGWQEQNTQIFPLPRARTAEKALLAFASGPSFVSRPPELPNSYFDMAPPAFEPAAQKMPWDRGMMVAASGPSFIPRPAELDHQFFDHAPPAFEGAGTKKAWDRGGLLAASGPSFVTAAPGDIQRPIFGFDLPPAAQSPVRRRTWFPDSTNLPDVFVAPPAAFVWAADPVLFLARDMTPIRAAALVGPTWIPSKPSDLLPPVLGYELTTPALVRERRQAQPVDPVFVTSLPSDLFAPQYGYDLTPSSQMPTRRRVPIPAVFNRDDLFVPPSGGGPGVEAHRWFTPVLPLLYVRPRHWVPDAVNLPDVYVPPPPSFTWAPEPVWLITKPRSSYAAILGGSTFVAGKPGDLVPPQYGYELTTPALLPVRPRRDLGRTEFVISRPTDLSPLGLGWELTSPALMPAHSRRPGAILGGTFVTALATDLLPLQLGYELSSPPLLPPARLRGPQAGQFATGAVFVTAAPGDLLSLRLGYEPATPPLIRARRRVPIPDVFNLPNVFVPPPTVGLTWFPDPTLFLQRARPRMETGATLVLSQPSDLTPLALGYDLSPPALVRSRRQAQPVDPVFVNSRPTDLSPPVYGYDLTPMAFVAPRMMPRRGGEMAVPAFVPAPPSDLAAPVLGFDLTPPTVLRASWRVVSGEAISRIDAFTPPSAFIWSPEVVQFLARASRRFVDPAVTFVASPPLDILPPVYGYDLAPPAFIAPSRAIRQTWHDYSFMVFRHIGPALIARVRLIGSSISITLTASKGQTTLLGSKVDPGLKGEIDE